MWPPSVISVQCSWGNALLAVLFQFAGGGVLSPLKSKKYKVLVVEAGLPSWLPRCAINAPHHVWLFKVWVGLFLCYFFFVCVFFVLFFTITNVRIDSSRVLLLIHIAAPHWWDQIRLDDNPWLLKALIQSDAQAYLTFSPDSILIIKPHVLLMF